MNSTPTIVGIIADHALNWPTPLTAVNIWHLGGAISNVRPDETAFAERSAQFMLAYRKRVDVP